MPKKKKPSGRLLASGLSMIRARASGRGRPLVASYVPAAGGGIRITPSSGLVPGVYTTEYPLRAGVFLRVAGGRVGVLSRGRPGIVLDR
ncbi:hypothetical protein [Streptomyces misionensis]|uniref:hypothetical protein n=1 Tax=Streptomyces misionensis TaxID=67331 RepID=UPI00340C4AA3